jgi:hypothetical protein
VEIAFKDGVGYDSAKLIESARGLVGVREQFSPFTADFVFRLVSYPDTEHYPEMLTWGRSQSMMTLLQVPAPNFWRPPRHDRPGR